MGDPLFSRPPPCPECRGGAMYHTTSNTWAEYTRCDRCSSSWMGHLTLATAPWTAPVVAAVIEVVDRHIKAASTWAAQDAIDDLRDELAGKKS